MCPAMKQTQPSRLFFPVRTTLAAACAVLFGAATAVGQSTGAASSPSGTPTNTDRYDTPGATSTQRDRDRDTTTYGTSTTRDQTQRGTLQQDTRQQGTMQQGTRTDPRTDPRADTTRTDTYGTGTTTTTDRTRATGTTTERGAYGQATVAGDTRLRWGDRRFVNRAADASQSELQLAQLAAERASNPEVRNYAERLVQDHSEVKSELMSLASQKGVNIDEEEVRDRNYRRLSNRTGMDFDREFLEHMIDEHEKDVRMYEKAANDARDPEVRNFAAKHLDHLREHLQMAQNLQRSIIPTGRTLDDDWEYQTRTHRDGTRIDPDPTTLRRDAADLESGVSTRPGAQRGTTDPRTESGTRPQTDTTGTPTDDTRPRRDR
jgi:putative membrane protein